MSIHEDLGEGLVLMEKLIFNYKTMTGKEGRLELIRNTPVTEDIIVRSILFARTGIDSTR